ncbi:hypothetical protein JJV70_11735 [Streptomyces sp. JJ66]|uniref:hypothetical protein n=1 Tax=Streptomyces sp. JJ66 TaxID=2803843 RepID=UPI001C58BA96|nr:hypothetical protein [Streptomyces sp. JJ66]MBW1602768.1 hypothetical protein [Streptomyces sp. JJ66]
MTPPSRPGDGPARPAPADDVNAAIRHLMEQPADSRRAEEYVRLLSLWAQATTPPTGATATWTTAA